MAAQHLGGKWSVRAFTVGPFAFLISAVCLAADEPPLKLERTIALKGPAGRLTTWP